MLLSNSRLGLSLRPWGLISLVGLLLGAAIIVSASELDTVRENYRTLVVQLPKDTTSNEFDAAAEALARRRLPLVQLLDWHAGNFLYRQVRSAGDTLDGAYLISGGRRPTAANLVRDWVHGVDILTAAYACEGSRFHGSKRVLRSLSSACGLMERALQGPASAKVIAGPLRIQVAEAASRALFRLGPTSSASLRASLREILRKVAETERPDAEPWEQSWLRFLLSIELREDEEAAEASREFTRAASELFLPDGTYLDTNGLLDVYEGARCAERIALLAYLAGETSLLPNEETVRAVEFFLIRGLLWICEDGNVDPLAAGGWLARPERDHAASLSEPFHMASGYLVAARGARTPSHLRLLWDRSRPRPPERIVTSSPTQTQFGPLLFAGIYETMRRVPTPEDEAERSRIEYYPYGGYLGTVNGEMELRLKLPASPMERGQKQIVQAAMGTGLVRLAGSSHDPALLAFWPTATLPSFVEAQVPDPSSFKIYPALCDAAVLGTDAVAGCSIELNSPEGMLTANKSWHILGSSVVLLVTDVEQKLFASKLRFWATAPDKARGSRWAVKFEEKKRLNLIRITLATEEGRYRGVPTRIVFESSEDGEEWRRLGGVSDLPRNGQPADDAPARTFLLLEENATCFRLSFPRGSTDGEVRLVEVELFHTRPDRQRRFLPKSENLALRGTATASSYLDEEHKPALANDGAVEPTTGHYPPPRTNLLLVSRTAELRVGYLDGSDEIILFPSRGERVNIDKVQWAWTEEIGLHFLRPATITVQTLNDETVSVQFPHKTNEQLAVQFLSGISADRLRTWDERAPRIVELEKDVHVINDERTGITSCALFSQTSRGERVAGGPGYCLYKLSGDALHAAVSTVAAASEFHLTKYDVEKVVLNGVEQPPRFIGQSLLLGPARSEPESNREAEEHDGSRD